MTSSELQTLFIARNLIELDETDSTNTYAQNMLLQSKPAEGTAILAYSQVQGRGQRQSCWESTPFKNLTFSIILYPHFIPVIDNFSLSKAISLGVYDFVKSILRSDVKIKWPNDIYYKEQKIAGILIENSLRGSCISQSVIGIGLNINQERFSSSSIAVSLKSITNMEYNLQDCFAKLCNFIEGRYLQLKANKTDVLNTDYLNALYLLNDMRIYKAGDTIFTAKITGISPEGKLILQTIDGNVQSYYFKEVSYIIKS